MSQSVKQCCGGWLILCGAFFAGASAGSIGYDLGRGACVSHTIEGLLGLVSALQSSRPHALSDQRTGKQVDRRGLPLLNLDWARRMVDYPGVETDPDGRITYRHFGADHGENGSLHFEQISYSDLDFSLFVAQCHFTDFHSLTSGSYLNSPRAWPASMIGPFGNEVQLNGFMASATSVTTTEPSSRLSDISTSIFATSHDQPHAFSMGQIPARATHFTSLSCPRPLVLASRIIRSAPADLLLAGWRDRPHVPLRHPSDSSWYSEENVKQLLDDKPQAVNKLLTWIFKPNQLTRHEREGIAMDLELIPTVPAHLELVQRSAKQRRQSRKEAAA